MNPASQTEQNLNPAEADSSERPLSTPSPFNGKRVLVPVDFSDCSRQALDYALSFAQHYEADLTILHAVHLNYYSAGGDFSAYDYPELLEETHRAGEQQLEEMARSAREHHPVNTVLETGHPGVCIVETAEKLGIGLIISSTHGRTGFRRALLGSTAEHVVRHAHCPVLTVPGDDQSPQHASTSPFPLKKILVPIDFSEASKDALSCAAGLAAHFGADIILLHVVQAFPDEYVLNQTLMNDVIGPLMNQTEARLDRMVGDIKEATDVHTSALIHDGKPYEEICHTAKTLDVDMIVLTTHGHTGLKHVVLGSTAERVVRHAECPVLVVRDKTCAGHKKRPAN